MGSPMAKPAMANLERAAVVPPRSEPNAWPLGRGPGTAGRVPTAVGGTWFAVVSGFAGGIACCENPDPDGVQPLSRRLLLHLRAPERPQPATPIGGPLLIDRHRLKPFRRGARTIQDRLERHGLAGRDLRLAALEGFGQPAGAAVFGVVGCMVRVGAAAVRGSTGKPPPATLCYADRVR